ARPSPRPQSPEPPPPPAMSRPSGPPSAGRPVSGAGNITCWSPAHPGAGVGRDKVRLHREVLLLSVPPGKETDRQAGLFPGELVLGQLRPPQVLRSDALHRLGRFLWQRLRRRVVVHVVLQSLDVAERHVAACKLDPARGTPSLEVLVDALADQTGHGAQL